MKPFQLIIILLLAGLAISLEFRSVVHEDIFFTSDNFIKNVLIAILSILTIVFLLLNYRVYNQSKRFVLFIIPALGCIFLVLIFAHMVIRNQINDSPTLFAADNPDLGNDGGFTLDFKINNYVIAQKMDHWSLTSYWGRYTKKGDTILLDLPLDFKMGRLAVIHDNTMSFIDDTVKFSIYKPIK